MSFGRSCLKLFCEFADLDGSGFGKIFIRLFQQFQAYDAKF